MKIIVRSRIKEIVQEHKFTYKMDLKEEEKQKKNKIVWISISTGQFRVLKTFPQGVS